MPYTGRLRFGLHDERDVFANVQYSRSFLLSLQYPYDPNARPHKCSGPAGNTHGDRGPDDSRRDAHTWSDGRPRPNCGAVTGTLSGAGGRASNGRRAD